MPLPHKVAIECPKCTYTKVVTRGDCLPDASMFQKCPKCGEIMKDSVKSVDESNSIIDTFLDFFGK